MNIFPRFLFPKEGAGGAEALKIAGAARGSATVRKLWKAATKRPRNLRELLSAKLGIKASKKASKFAVYTRQQRRHADFARVFAAVSEEFAEPRAARRKIARGRLKLRTA